MSGKERTYPGCRRRVIRAQPHAARTITADNGTEFHGYAARERTTPTRFDFATPHHAWSGGRTRTLTA
jgi:IS30 family transposase